MRHLDLSVHGVGCRRCVRDVTARLRGSSSPVTSPPLRRVPDHGPDHDEEHHP